MWWERYSSLPWVPIYTQLSKGSSTPPAVDTESMSLYTEWSMAATVAFTMAVFALEAVLDSRQKRCYLQTHFPKELETTVGAIDRERAAADASTTTMAKAAPEATLTKDEVKDGATGKQDAEDDNDDATQKKDAVDKMKPLLPQLKDKFAKSQAYGLDKINFGMVAGTYDTIESVIFLLVGLMPYAWDLAVRKGEAWFGWTETENEIKISLLFLAGITVFGTIKSLPFELYSTFQIERKHGFNKQTLGLFFSDHLKSLALTFAIGGPFLALLLKIIKAGGEYFYLYVWALMFVFSMAMMTIVPVFIMPLFNKYEPLPDNELNRKIRALAASLKYPLTKLFVMDGSKRSSHSNAFMFGFGKNKRIVLFDTLLQQVHDDEILAILGHELGHWKLGHSITNFVITQAYFGAAFYSFSLTYGSTDLYAAFGFDDPNRPVATLIALLLFFQTLWAPVDKILSFIMTVHSRLCEFAADKFSVDLDMSKPLQSGLAKIHLENLGSMAPDRWYSAYHHSHPPLVERLSAMQATQKKRE